MPINQSEADFFHKLEQQAIASPAKPLNKQTIQDFRATGVLLQQYATSTAKTPFIEKTISTRDDHTIPIRVYNPQLGQTKPVFIMYPGCGYILDLFDINAAVASQIANYAKAKVIIVNYRLAPEASMPIPIDDAYDAVKYISMYAETFDIDPNKIIIGGLSSGAHAAAVITNLARTDRRLNILHQILFNGIYDLTNSQHGYDGKPPLK